MYTIPCSRCSGWSGSFTMKLHFSWHEKWFVYRSVLKCYAWKYISSTSIVKKPAILWRNSETFSNNRSVGNLYTATHVELRMRIAENLFGPRQNKKKSHFGEIMRLAISQQCLIRASRIQRYIHYGAFCSANIFGGR